MKSKLLISKPLYLILIGLAFIIVSTFFVYYSLSKLQQSGSSQVTTNEIHVNKNEQQWKLSTPGKSVLEYVSLPSDGPKIVKSTVEPLHVNAGEKQTFQVEINSEYNVEYVKAYVTTDSGLFEIPLRMTSFRELSYDDFKHKKAYADQEGKVSLNVKNDDNPKAPLNGFLESLFTKAKASNELRYVFTGDWIAADSRNTAYYIRFITEDENKKLDKVTLGWSAPCSLPVSKDISKWPTEPSQDTFGYFNSDNEFVITSDSSCSDNKIINVEDTKVKVSAGKTLVIPNDEFVGFSNNQIFLEEKSKLAIPK